MLAMMPRLAHLLDTASGPTWWLLAALVAVVLLAGEHAVVKHGGLNRRSAGGLAVAVVVAGSVLIGGQPLVEAGQRPNGLPDLISDPPRPRYLKEIIDADGDPRLVVTFDGYIHNIGDGPLEVVGNPQLEKGMVQRVRLDGEWQEVGFPTVYFENDDGHNHFHLIEAIGAFLEDLRLKVYVIDSLAGQAWAGECRTVREAARVQRCFDRCLDIVACTAVNVVPIRPPPRVAFPDEEPNIPWGTAAG